ncbi:DNA methyltransferase [Gracilimonas sediminicola]|uniref:DNA methyltransferase n=1 Tax=Gracilimonas sediminicola TaxID=2952158 RepID=UPI0038D4CA0D
MPDNKFNLAIVDPPYGINAPNMAMGTNESRIKNGYPSKSTAQKLKKDRLTQGAGKLKDRFLNNSEIDWDQIPGEEYFTELFRVSVNQIIFGGNYFDLPPTRGVFCWDKRQPWENFSQWEMAWTSFDSPAAHFSYSVTGGSNKEEKIHPTQKPTKVYLELLRRYAKPGDLILDTHGGSGSIALACWKEKYQLVWFEKDSEYYKAATKRFLNRTESGPLFKEKNAIQLGFED